jgi:hypothetical protein
MKQTAVEWLIEQWPILESQIPERILDQAKEMEKEQISIAYKEGWNCPHGEGFPETGEQYYNETYKQQ